MTGYGNLIAEAPGREASRDGGVKSYWLNLLLALALAGLGMNSRYLNRGGAMAGKLILLAVALVTLLLAALVPAAGVVVLIGGGALFAWRRSHQDGVVSDGNERRIAVLPFQNLGDSADAYFADGITDAVRGKLTALPSMRVIGSNSSARRWRSTTGRRRCSPRASSARRR